MLYSQIESTVYTWASTNSSIPVIFANENGVRPDNKYITLNIISYTPIGQPYSHMTDINGDRYIDQNEDFTVELNAFYPGSNDDLQVLKNSLKKDVVIQSINDSGLVIRDENGTVMDISTLVDDTIEKRYLYEFRMSHTETIFENVSFIETVDIEQI